MRRLPVLQVLLRAQRRKLNRILNDERSGAILAGEHKAHLTDTINKFLRDHKARRERGREKIEKFMQRD